MQIKHANNAYSNIIEPFSNPVELLIQPGKQTKIHIKSQVYTANEAIRIIQPSPDLKDTEDLIICPALTTTQNRKYTLLIHNFLEHTSTLKKGCHISIFSILTPEQTKYIKPVNPALLRRLLHANVTNCPDQETLTKHIDFLHLRNLVMKPNIHQNQEANPKK